MKILIARMNHETNTFSPVSTPLCSFGLNGPDYGPAAYRANKGAATAMGAFIDLAEQWGAEIVTPLSATASPSGPVAADAYEAMCGAILDATAGCDVILLDLHGAMVAESTDDGEGDLVKRIRERCPVIPIAVSLDLHGNVTQKLIDHVDIVTGFKTFPHVDMYESGYLAGSIVRKVLDGQATPVLTWRQLPLMSHGLKSATTASSAMKAAVDKAREMEKRADIHAVTVMAGFSLADIPQPCMSVIVVGEDLQTSQTAADELAEEIWRNRDGFIYVAEDLKESVARALRFSSVDVAQGMGGDPQGPVLLLDPSDNCMSGGTCDTMDVLQEALAQGLTEIAVGPICDPEAVDELFRAGEGATVSLPVGNKQDLSRIGLYKVPPTLTGRVKCLSNGEYVISGPTYRGMACCMGRTVLFAIEGAEIVLTEQRHEPWDLGVFNCVGLDVLKKRYVILKSKMYWRPVFFPIARAYVECNSEGVGSSDYSLFDFRKVRRPVFPLDQQVASPFHCGEAGFHR